MIPVPTVTLQLFKLTCTNSETQNNYHTNVCYVRRSNPINAPPMLTSTYLSQFTQNHDTSNFIDNTLLFRSTVTVRSYANKN